MQEERGEAIQANQWPTRILDSQELLHKQDPQDAWKL
jgi:hypothetical protein